jgi:hypothetical protein
MNIESYQIVQVLKGKKKLSLWERMQRWLLAFGVITALVAPPSYAVDTDKVAHASVSAVGTMAFYGLYKAILNRDCRLQVNRPENCPLSNSGRLGAASFAAATMFAVGLLKEMSEKPDGGDIIANGVGSVGAVLTIQLFEF